MTFRGGRLCACIFALSATATLACSSSTQGSAAAADGGPGSTAAMAAGNCPPVGSQTCTNNPPATQANFDQCEQSKTDARCGAKYIDYLKCLGAKETCGADGKIDSASLVPCLNLYADFSLCQTLGSIKIDGGPTDAASGG